ncbi:Copia protein [Phytophthora citrophthora]|uniref:Copia protein n=1 Tax=Phytophthora citrophthora TaxID=4793 RepID=A0AAD9GFZ3_9STRA|nr:Copia protein [Phytophthora citrophthora]
MQASVTDDTCKSELVAASTCVEDLLWEQKLLKELKLERQAGKMLIDNQSTIKVCMDAGNFDGVRRCEKKSRKIAKLVNQGNVSVEYVPMEDNVADMFTKAMGPQRFEKLRKGLGVRDVKGVYGRLGVEKERQDDEDVIDRSHDGKGAG